MRFPKALPNFFELTRKSGKNLSKPSEKPHFIVAMILGRTQVLRLIDDFL